jgi:hypothetical protein
MTPILIAVPDALLVQKSELESALAGIATEESKLAVRRKELQSALNTIDTGIAVLSGQPVPALKSAAPGTARKPMSPEARQRIAEGLRKAALAKKAAKAARVAAAAPQPSAPEAPVVVAAPQELAETPADAPAPGSAKNKKASRKVRRA